MSGTAVSGAQVTLWRERAGQPSFQQIAHTTTDGAGRYTFTLGRGIVMADQAWYVTSGTLRSATIEQHVRAVVALTPSAATMTAGRSIVLRGHVTPAHAGETVLIEQRHGAAWHVIARPRLSKGSTYSVSHRFARSGKTELRAVFQGDGRNLKSVSRLLTLTVRR